MLVKVRMKNRNRRICQCDFARIFPDVCSSNRAKIEQRRWMMDWHVTGCNDCCLRRWRVQNWPACTIIVRPSRALRRASSTIYVPKEGWRLPRARSSAKTRGSVTGPRLVTFKEAKGNEAWPSRRVVLLALLLSSCSILFSQCRDKETSRGEVRREECPQDEGQDTSERTGRPLRRGTR